MSRRPGPAFGALITALLLSGGLTADQIVLKDGDRVTGAIVKKEGGKLTIDSKHFGMITVDWADVESIQSDKALTVVLRQEGPVKAAIRTEEGRVRVGTAEASQSAALSDVVTLRNDAEEKAYEKLRHPGLLDLWEITGSVNIAGAKGNAATSTLTTPVNVVRASNTSKTTAYFNAIRSVALVNGVSSQTARAVRGGWGYSRNLTSRIFANTFNDYEYDKFQSLDLRTVVGGGLGYQVWKGEKGRFEATGGGSWNRESFTPESANPFTRHAGEVYWGDDLNFKINSKTSLVQGFRMFNNMTRSGEYRMNFDISAAVTLNKWLTWNVSVGDRYLSQPVTGRKRNDVLYTTGLGFKFSR